MGPTLIGLAIVLLVATSAAVGAVAGVAAYFGGARGERRRFEAELAPLRAAISEVADRFDHWTKRERRRDAVAKGGPVDGPGQPSDAAPPSRRDVLRDIARRMGG